VKPVDNRFEKLSIWFRILNLPFGLMNDKKGKDLASRVGKVDKMDVDGSGRAWGDFLRVRATINITESLMGYVSVFSQKRQETDVFTFMYELLPIYCFSCGLLGHASLGCLNPAERDEEGLLPYHSSRLCVPDERKKKSTGNTSGQGSQSNTQSSGPGNGRSGPYTQTSDVSARSQNEKVFAGEVNSPVKPKPRARKPRANASVNNGKAASVVKGDTRRMSGQKRKEYRLKVLTTQNTDPDATLSTGLPTVAIVPASDVLPATEDGGSELVDSNKKHKLDTNVGQHRSADPAAAAEQPRLTQ
jgi:hypothetical protein